MTLFDILSRHKVSLRRIKTALHDSLGCDAVQLRTEFQLQLLANNQNFRHSPADMLNDLPSVHSV